MLHVNKIAFFRMNGSRSACRTWPRGAREHPSDVDSGQRRVFVFLCECCAVPPHPAARRPPVPSRPLRAPRHRLRVAPRLPHRARRHLPAPPSPSVTSPPALRRRPQARALSPRAAVHPRPRRKRPSSRRRPASTLAPTSSASKRRSLPPRPPTPRARSLRSWSSAS